MRLVRHLSFSNVIAVVALFVALGGAAYAGSKVNGKNIVNASIGGGKLKREAITADKIKQGTITGAQIKEGSLSSNAIDLSTLGTVPSANSANSATTSGTAANAENAKRATEAETARRATIAGEAETLEGKTAAQLTLSCKAGTEFYGGMCWDESQRTARTWLVALEECGDEGGRLPTIGELIAFISKEGIQAVGQIWSSDVVEISGVDEEVLTSDESGRTKLLSGQFHGYRCVFPRSN